MPSTAFLLAAPITAVVTLIIGAALIVRNERQRRFERIGTLALWLLALLAVLVVAGLAITALRINWLGSISLGALALGASALVALAVVAGSLPRRSTPVPAFDMETLDRRSVWSVGPRWAILWWLATSVVAVGVIVASGVVAQWDPASQRDVIVFTYGELSTAVPFPGWASSRVTLLLLVLQLIAGVAALAWNAARRIGGTRPVARRLQVSRIVALVLWAGVLWALAQQLDEIAIAGLVAVGVEEPLEFVAQSPIASSTYPLLALAGILRGVAAAVVIGQLLAQLVAPRSVDRDE